MTSLEESRANGKAIVASVFLSYATSVLFVVLFGGHKFEKVLEVTTFGIQIILTLGLFVAIWSGRLWARWVFASLVGLGVIFIVWVLFEYFSWQLVTFACYFLALAAALCLPGSVTVFLEGQKQRRQEPNQPPQRNAGSRPFSGDSSASETPSSVGPCG